MVQATDAAQTWGCCGCGAGWQLQLIQPLAWELPYAAGAALKRQKKKKRLPAKELVARPYHVWRLETPHLMARLSFS